MVKLYLCMIVLPRNLQLHDTFISSESLLESSTLGAQLIYVLFGDYTFQL